MRNSELMGPQHLAVARRITSNIPHWLSLILLLAVLLTSAMSHMLEPTMLCIDRLMVNSLKGEAKIFPVCFETHLEPQSINQPGAQRPTLKGPGVNIC